MKLRSITAAVLVTIALAGCGTTKQQTPSSYRFDYQTTQAAEGVIRAFDDGRRTIVQFVDLDEARPTFKDEDGQGIQEVELQGQYAVLPRKYQTLTVTTGSGAEVVYAYVGKSLEPQDNTAALVTTSAPPAPKTDTMDSELARAQEELRKTKAELAQALAQLAQQKQQQQQPAAQVSPIYFNSGSSFGIVPKDAALLLAHARDAQTVKLVGYTDATGDRAANQRLSRARAEAVKSWLVARGVQAAKITTEGGGVAIGGDNTTDAGRKQNRRVDVSIK